MEKKVNTKFTILKLSLLITFLITIVVTTVIMGNRNEVDAATAPLAWSQCEYSH